MLKNLERWLDEAETYATERGFDVEDLLTARLHIDQYPLTRQIQAACDSAKLATARLAEAKAPVHDDVETTLAELRTRIGETLAFIEGFSAEDFEGKADAKLYLPFLQGGYVVANDYLHQFALANFYFHITNAYAILRHNGVKLGKRTFIGHMNVQMPEA
ncbi:MAG: DUF1993 domain-containing protein [Proteobacteria bacterium]|nr:DUF1993 domain-containing protein [Pseudomonadota bacterium]